VAKGTDLTKKIFLSPRLFSTAGYFITLTVQNFFGKTSTTTASTIKNANPNLPSLSISGAERVVIKPNQAITVRSLSAFQPCAETVVITYEWTVTLNNVRVNVVNTGNDRTALSLAANALLAGNTYLVTVTASVPSTLANLAAQASASMRIEVKSGNVIAQVFGGTTRKVFIQDYLTVDGSSSYDENLGVSVRIGLTYKWTCAYQNALDFGTDCSSVFQSLSTTNAILYVYGPILSPSKIYGFTLTVKASDGRTGAITVSVQQLSASTATTSIVTTRTTVNSNLPLTVNGIVSASFAVNASWAVSVEGTSLALNALTPLKKVFTGTDAVNGIIYPLSFPARVFTQGTSVTFRLTAIYSKAISLDTASVCEIVVVVNSGPTGGKLTVDPATGGLALYTVFSIISSEWSDVDIPLSYEFAYQVSPTTPILSIKPRSSSNVADTELGEGIVSRSYLVTIINNIYDKDLAVTSVNTTAEVKVKADIDPVTYFGNKAAEFGLTRDTSKATAALNNVAVTVNKVNCTLASTDFCAALNRQPCSATPQTCSSCMAGFNGRAGSANSLCFNATAPVVARPVGAACNVSSQCLQGSCTSNICAVPIKMCPSVNSQECSGNGKCVYSDQNGFALNKICTQAETFCTASCSCTGGYGGNDCTLSPAEKVTRDLTRASMCEYVILLANTLQHSSDLLDSLVSSLLVAYDPAEVISPESVTVCQNALTVVTGVAAEGYLGNAMSSTKTFIVDLMSEFITPAHSVNGTAQNNSASASQQINDAATNIAQAFMTSMVDGQDPQTVISENARFTFRRDLASDMLNTTLQPPPSEDDAEYGAASSGIQLLDNALAACTGKSGYVGLSLMQWGTNPFRKDNGSQVGTAQIKFDNFAADSSYVPPEGNFTTVAYYIVNQFNEPQDFNFSISLADALIAHIPNFTFPECTLFDGTAYVPCKGCSISSYTNYNVTFACMDPTQLCSGGSRRLGAYPQHRADRALPQRYLQSSNDDDGQSSEVTGSDSIQYAALFEAIGTEVVSTLSQNPFAVDWSKASAILSFVCILLFCIVTGYIFFSKWDQTDRGYLVYAKNESDRAKIKLRHAYMLQKQLQDETEKQSATERESSLLKAKKMFRISENTYQILQEAFEMEHTQRMNLRKKLNGTMSRLAHRFDFSWETKTSDEQDKADATADQGKSGKGENDHLFELFRAEETQRHLEYNAVFEEEDAMETRDELYIANVVADFLNSVMPEGSVSQGKQRWTGLMHRMLKEHDYTAMFYDPSLKYPRSLRFLNVSMQILINLFVDTIFYGVFYPDTGICEQLVTEDMCIEQKNSVLDANMCIWHPDTKRDNGGSCSLTPPPNDFTFQCILVVLCQITALPIAFFYDFLLKEYCTRRPNLEKWGLNTVNYLGRSTQNKHAGATQEATESRLKEVFNEVDELRRKARDSDISKYLLSKQDQERKNLEEINFISTKLYNEFAFSTQKEAELMLEEVKKFLDEYTDYQNVPWQSSKVTAIRSAKVRAIQQYLGILPDGRPTPLSLLDSLMYRNPMGKLVANIEESRKRAKEISTVLEELGNTELMNRDVALMQFFILEQFSPFKRYVLTHRLFTFSVSSALPISPSLWVFCWAVVLLSLLFYLYWVLTWGLSNGGVTLEQWGINFSFALLEDVFAVQGFRCYALFILSMFAIDPQLRYVYRVLNRVAVSYTQDELDNNLSEIKIVQHFSGACRVARTRVAENLSTAKILRHIDDVDIEVCRLNGDVGMAILAVIVVSIPVAVGMLDFILGEIALDSALPAMFSMFLLGNYFIIQFGAIALAIPYIVLGGYYGWKHYVFAPAVRNIRTMKHEIEHGTFFRNHHRNWNSAQRMNQRLTFGSFMASMVHVVKRAALLLAYYINSPLLILADASKLFTTEAQLRKKRHRLQWQLMNIDQNMQGMVVNEDENIGNVEGLAERLQFNSQKMSAREGRNFKLDQLHKVIERLPEEVRALQLSSWTESWESGEKQATNFGLTKLIFGIQSADGPATPPDNSVGLAARDPHSQGGMVLLGASAASITNAELASQYRPMVSSEEVEQFREVYTEYTDVHTALNRILSTYQRLVASGEAKRVRNKYARYLHQIEDYGECDALIHISDYMVMLNEVWGLFRPGGVAMDEEEQEEIANSFSSWMVTEGYHADFEELDVEDHDWWDKYNQKYGEEDETEDSAFYANFGNFCDWFKSMVANIEYYRERNRQIEMEKKAVDDILAKQRAKIVARALVERARKEKAKRAAAIAGAARALLDQQQQEQQQQSAVPFAKDPHSSSGRFGYSSEDSKDEAADSGDLSGGATTARDRKLDTAKSSGSQHITPGYVSSDSSDGDVDFGGRGVVRANSASGPTTTGKFAALRPASDESMDSKRDFSNP
jgi:hypothetical protein